MGKRVGIFTTNSVEKVHPRIQMQLEFLQRKGFTVDIIRATTRREAFFFELRNWFSLKYFKWGFISQNTVKIKQYDVVHIYDFQLLPLAKKAKKEGKKVIYETLDDMVHLHFDAVKKKVPFLKVFQNIVISRMAKYERKVGDLFCDAVIVNSGNLLSNFSEAELIYYASPLEGVHVRAFDQSKETAFVYLGKLTESKGVNTYLNLIESLNVKMLFLGKAYDSASRRLVDHRNVVNLGNMDVTALRFELDKLLEQYNLIGLSIIIPENKSYALQEANKDIDYLAMGMPFIGNTRVPTYEKIKLGAGVVYSDTESLKKMLKNESDKYSNCSKACDKLYYNYNSSKFEEKLLQVYKNL